MRDQALRLRQLVAGDGAELPVIAKDMRRKKSKAYTIAVTSGKGGVGKTSLAVNLGMILAGTSSKVLIVDADLGLANVDVMLGMEPGRHIGHLLLGNCNCEDVSSTGPGGVTVISGGSGLRQLAAAGGEGRAILLEKLRAYYDNFDFVVIDTSPGISMNVLDFLVDADKVLLVTTCEPTSLQDSYAALKAITGEMPEKDIVPVVNSANAAQATQVMQTLNHVASNFLDIKCDHWHNVDSDALVGRAILDRKPLVRTYPKSPAAMCINRIAKEIISDSSQLSAVSRNREEAYALA